MKNLQIYKNALQIIMLLVYSVWSCSMMPWQALIVKEEGEVVMCLGKSMTSTDLSSYALNVSVVNGTTQLVVCVCTESNCLSAVTTMSLSELYQDYLQNSRSGLGRKILCNFEMFRHPQGYSSIYVPLKKNLLSSFSLSNPLHVFIRTNNHTTQLEQPTFQYVLGLQSNNTFCHSCGMNSVSCDGVNFKCLCKPQYYGEYCQVMAAGELRLRRDSYNLSNPRIEKLSSPLAISESSLSFIAVRDNWNETTTAYILLSLNNSATQTLNIVNSLPFHPNNYPSNLDSSVQLTIQPHHLLYLSVSRSTDTSTKLTFTSLVNLRETSNFQLSNKTNCMIANLTLAYMEFFIVMNSTEPLSVYFSGSSQSDFLFDIEKDDSDQQTTHSSITLDILVYVLIGTIGLSLLCLFLASFQFSNRRENDAQKKPFYQRNTNSADQVIRQQQQQQQLQPLSTATHNVLSNNNNQDKYKMLNPHKQKSIMDVESSTTSQLARHKDLPQLSSSLSSNSFTIFALQQQEIYPMHIPSSSQTPIVSLNYSNSQPFQSQNLMKELQKGQHSQCEQSNIPDSTHTQHTQVVLQRQYTDNDLIQQKQNEQLYQKQQQYSPSLNQISQNLFQQISQGIDNHMTFIPSDRNRNIIHKELNFSNSKDNLNPEDQKNQEDPQTHSFQVTFCPSKQVLNEESKPLNDETLKQSPVTSANFFESWLPSISLTQQHRPLVQTNTDQKLQNDLEPIIKEEAESLDEYIGGPKTKLDFQPSCVELSNQAVQVPKPNQQLKSERSGESSFSSSISDGHSDKSNEQSQQNIEGYIQQNYVHPSENELNEQTQTGRVQILRKMNYDHDTISYLNDFISAEEIVRENSRNQNNPIVASSTADQDR